MARVVFRGNVHIGYLAAIVAASNAGGSGSVVANMYPEAKSVGRWLKYGWPVALAYVVGFAAIMAVVGWHPTDKRGKHLERVARLTMAYPAT